MHTCFYIAPYSSKHYFIFIIFFTWIIKKLESKEFVEGKNFIFYCYNLLWIFNLNFSSDLILNSFLVSNLDNIIFKYIVLIVLHLSFCYVCFFKRQFYFFNQLWLGAKFYPSFYSLYYSYLYIEDLLWGLMMVNFTVYFSKIIEYRLIIIWDLHIFTNLMQFCYVYY